MINILYLHNKSEIGGGEKSLYNLWLHLDRKSFKPVLILPEKGLFSEEVKKLDIETIFLKVPKLEFKNFFSIIIVIWKLVLSIKRNKINVIHSYAPRNNIIAAVVGALCKVAVIWHERNLIFGSEKDITRRFMKLPNCIICNSKAIARRFKKNGKIPKKVKVVYNGVDTNKFAPGEKQSATVIGFNIDLNKKIVGLISNLSKRKMPENLFHLCPIILKQFSNTKFIVVGGEFLNEEKGRFRKLVQQSENLGFRDDIIFTGFIDKVPEIIKIFDVGIAVTEKEACSRAILELMSSEKAVVAYDTGGNSELVEHEVNGFLVEYGDYKAFANSVICLLKDDVKRISMGKKGRERVQKFFDIKLNTQKIQQIYKGVLKSN